MSEITMNDIEMQLDQEFFNEVDCLRNAFIPVEETSVSTNNNKC